MFWSLFLHKKHQYFIFLLTCFVNAPELALRMSGMFEQWITTDPINPSWQQPIQQLSSVLFYRSHAIHLVESRPLPLTKAPQMLANISCFCLTIWSFTCSPITWNCINVWKLWANEVMGKIIKYWLFKCVNHFIFSWRQTDSLKILWLLLAAGRIKYLLYW